MIHLIYNLILFILLFIFSFFIFKKQKYISLLKKENEELTKSYDQLRIFKHDFDNIIITIGGYLKTNDTNELNKFYSFLLKDNKKIQNLSILSSDLINDSGINSLISNKYKLAQNNGITIDLDIFFDFSKLKMPSYEFTRILGILLDNAIEASIKSTNKKINLFIRDSVKNKVQILKIENTFENKINTDKIFEKGFSQKEKHSGIGLWEVKQIINNHPNINLQTSIQGDYFVQNLEINYNFEEA